MKVVFFLLGLVEVGVLFASAIAVMGFIVLRLVRWIGRVAAPKPVARKLVKPPRKKYLAPVPESPLQ